MLQKMVLIIRIINQKTFLFAFLKFCIINKIFFKCHRYNWPITLFFELICSKALFLFVKLSPCLLFTSYIMQMEGTRQIVLKFHKIPEYMFLIHSLMNILICYKCYNTTNVLLFLASVEIIFNVKKNYYPSFILLKAILWTGINILYLKVKGSSCYSHNCVNVPLLT